MLRGEPLYIPFVGAIIERDNNGVKEVLIQTRQKDTDKVYSGSLEIPGGKFRAFEDVYESLRREAVEESGMKITFVDGEKYREDFESRGAHSSLIHPYCVTQTIEGPFFGLIFLCHAEGEPKQMTNETKGAHWMAFDDLRKIVEETPERIYIAFLGPLKKYLRV
jgi:8-oxo-dGTP pyrophosphatase MutT (NUDIX family)